MIRLPVLFFNIALLLYAITTGQHVSAQVALPSSVSSIEGNRSSSYASEIKRIDQQLLFAGNYFSKDVDSTEHIFTQLLQQSIKAGYTYGIAHSLIGISRCYNEQGNHVKADALLDQAFPYCERSEIKKSYILSIWYETKAINAKNRNQTDSSISFYKKALKFATAANDTTILLSVSVNMGILYLNAGLPDNCIPYLNDAVALSFKKDSFALPLIYCNLAQAYSNLHKDSTMLYYAGLSEKLALQEQDPRVLRHLASLLGEHYLNKKAYPKAIAYFKKGLEISKSHATINQFPFLYGLSICYSEMKEWPAAKDYGKQALAIVENSERKTQNIVSFYDYLADTYASSGAYKTAYEYSKRYSKLNDSMNDIERKKALDLMNVQYQTSRKDLLLQQQQNKMRQKDFWMLGTMLVGVIAISVLVFLYIISRHKQKLKSIQLLESEQRHKVEQLQSRMQGEEKERERIARELHDGVASVLSAAKMQLNNIHHTSITELTASDMYHNGIRLIQEAYDEIRQTAHDLSGDKLSEKGFINNLYSYCQRVHTPPLFNVHCHHFGIVPELNADMAVSIYRMVQELLHNIQKHAYATEVNIQSGYDGAVFFVTIEDNGKGFSEEDIKEDNGIGWKNMAARIAIWNGSWEMDSRPGAGTTVYLHFNLPASNNSPMQES